jgi:hypothetical protein
MRIHPADRKILRDCARGWRRYGFLGAECSVRNGSSFGYRPIVELKTGTARGVKYLGEYDTYEEAHRYRVACMRYMDRQFCLKG